jgi:pSer/pThr/pTyr-binding forkhead associated (FHA) protein
MALLCVLDDGRDDGEWVRIRTDHFVIGRTEGNLLIPHDTMISSRHAEITRHADKGHHRWFLTDLQSTNGTYVRVSSVPLRHGQEVLIGTHRFRFEAGAVDLGEGDAELGMATRGWQQVNPVELLPALVELTPQGEGQRFTLDRQDHWIGRDARQCSVVLAHDALVSPRHARMHRDAQGRWVLDNASSLNGTWLRIPKLQLDVTCQFQLGEQRFLLKILG